MTIIVFLLDTSSSMNQRVFFGGRPTLLDVAKRAVETFVKVRQRSSIDSRGDRYMLLTFEEFPDNIKAGWKENLGTFMSELKNLQANGLTTLSQALRQSFDFLNVNRMQHGIDTYGQGRCPFYLEPSIIVAITDGGQMSSKSGVQDELKLQGTSPGCELTREPFRWDQRLFGLVLRMSGQPSNERGDAVTGLVPSDTSAIDAMCEVTGGRSYSITSQRMLHQCIDSLVQKVQAGVVIHFEKIGPDPPAIGYNDGKGEEDEEEKNGNSKNSWQNCRRMIYVPRTPQKGGFAGGFWPIPESFWPDPSMPSLPPRSAHPNVKFTCDSHEPLVMENFPFDKYELEPSLLTQYILGRKLPNVCWQVVMPTSSRNMSASHPFGYLKASTTLTCVNLFVMPYNYPVLLPLLDDLFRIHRLKPTNEWKAQFGMYLSTMPPYYAGPLKRALVRIGAAVIAQLVSEENYLSHSVLNYLKKIKTQAKAEYDKACSDVGMRVSVVKPALDSKRAVSSYKNAFDVPRHQLLDHLGKLRTLFLRPSPFSLIQQESLHNMPVGQMGNYQEYLKRMPPPLREIESTPVRQHMFGNPFKIDKRMMVDEADIDLLGAGTARVSKRESQSPVPGIRNSKIKPGPLPKNYVYRSRSSSPMPSPARSIDEENDIKPPKYINYIPDSDYPVPSPVVDDLLAPKDNNLLNRETKVEHKLLYDGKIEGDIPLSSDSSYYSSWSHDLDLNNGGPIKNVDELPDTSSSLLTSMESIIDEIPIHTNNNNNTSSNHTIEEDSYSSEKENTQTQTLTNGSSDRKRLFPKLEDTVPKSSKKRAKLDNSSANANSTPMDEETITRQNISLRVELYKEIRRPIIRMDTLISRLSCVIGTVDTKVKFIKSLRKEAVRFKRWRIADLLDKQVQQILTA